MSTTEQSDVTVDLTKPYVWSTTRGAWQNSGCAGCEFHVPDASPETTALIARLDRELNHRDGE